MKKLIVVSLVAGVFLWSGASQIVWAKTKKTKEKKSAETSKATKVKATSDNKKKEALTQARSALNNSNWSVSFTGDLPKGMAPTDDLTFKDNQFSSALFSGQGFCPTNFSLTMQDDGVVVFETMQTSEKDGTLFWRGELDADGKSMKGMFSHVLADQSSQDVYFSGNKASEAAAAAAPATAAAAAPASPEQKTSEGV
jgi:hypothetical protein